jgi:hypothetical protein
MVMILWENRAKKSKKVAPKISEEESLKQLVIIKFYIFKIIFGPLVKKKQFSTI